METAVQSPFRERLAGGRVILADGAMGTQLFDRGVGYDECLDAQTIDRPLLVEQVHRDYITAGAELIETNTFGANRVKLAAYGLEERVHEINRRAPRLARAAREICGESVFVAASVGPTGRAIEPFGNTSRQQVHEVFHEQISALLEGGPDLLVLETFGDLAEIVEGMRAARDLTDLPIVAQMTFDDDLRTPQGHSPEQVADVLASSGADVIGANCSVGSNTLLALTERFIAAGVRYVAVMPNAGWPTRMGNRVVYHSSPEYMAAYGRRMTDVGAAIVGGCCGTTPAHIRALRAAIESQSESTAAVEVVASVDAERESASAVDVSPLAGKLGRQRVISVEISPPRGANPRKAIQGARLLRDAGVDAVNIFDSAMARVRMSAMATSVMIKQQLDMEAIVHFTTRDRNLMAIQSDLIGGHAMGIRAVLALTGDPPPLSSQAEYKAVYDIDSIALIRIIKQLNQGVDTAGNSIGTPTHFLVGCALNPTADDLDWELEKFQHKLEAGADFVMTQPVYDPILFRRVVEAIRPADIPILMGVLPLQSHRHALFIHNELAGVKLTESVLRRMERAGANGMPEGLRIAREMIDDCGPLAAGLYIIPSFGRYEMAAQLVVELRSAA
jgi:methionine synthase I (cobalamin-dependent)/5,10-methylenetetrahydrofolate reductase